MQNREEVKIFISTVEKALMKEDTPYILQLLSNAEGISQLKKYDGGLVFHLFSYAVSKADSAVAEAILQNKHLKGIFIEPYLQDELNNDFLEFIHILLEKIGDLENIASSLKIIKLIYDAFLIYAPTEIFPNTAPLTQSTYIVYKNELHFYDSCKQILKQVLIYEQNEMRILDLFAAKSIDIRSIERYLIESNIIDDTAPEPLKNSELLDAPFQENIHVPATFNPIAVRPINYQKLRDLTPTPADFSFKYQKIKGRNQKAIISQISQYLTFEKNYELILKIQGGICAALTHSFDETSIEQWEKLIGRILQWNGSEEVLDSHHLKTDFERLLFFIKKYQLGEKKYHNYFYVGTHLDILLEQVGKDGIFLINPWHQIVVKKGEDNLFLIYDPNFDEGIREEKNLNDVKILIQNSLGKHMLAFSHQKLFLPEPTIGDGNSFIQEGALFFLFYQEHFELFSKLPQVNNVNSTALKGLLLRNNDGVPLWAVSTNNKNLSSYLHSLVETYINNNPNFKSELKQSLEGLSSTLLRRLGLDFFYIGNSDDNFIKKINQFYTIDPAKLAQHKKIVSICEQYLRSIEDSYEDPIILTVFYDLMHSLHHFTNRWDIVNDDSVLHLNNPVQGSEFFIIASEEQPSHLYLLVIDLHGEEKKYALPPTLQELFETVAQYIPSLYKKPLVHSTSCNSFRIFKEKSPEKEELNPAPQNNNQLN